MAMCAGKLGCSAAINHINDEHHDGNEQQNMDQATCDVERETEQPQD
jgi:hypothetical protein